MTEQQYRVHACDNTEPHEAHQFRGTYRKPSLPGVEITETFQCEGVERPVPTNDELELCDCGAPLATCQAAFGRKSHQPSPHPPTREQIAKTLYKSAYPTSVIVFDREEAVMRDRFLHTADAVLALIQNGADR